MASRLQPRADSVRGQFALYDNSKLFLEEGENIMDSRHGDVNKRNVITAGLKDLDTGSLDRPLTFSLVNPEVRYCIHCYNCMYNYSESL